MAASSSRKRQGLVQRADRHAADLDRVELLKAVERARHDRVLEGGDGAQRDQLAVRAGDVDVAELVGVEPVDPLNLRNDLVAAAGDIEAVDEVAADHGRQIRARPAPG